jgi:D-aspartate ligase
MEMIRPLGLAGIPCAAVVPAGDPARFSRFTSATVNHDEIWSDSDGLVDRLLRFGARSATPPVLFYDTDDDLLLTSRNRERLGEVFRFVMPDHELVEDLVDKARFQALAQRLHMSVAKGIHLRAAAHDPASELQFPLVIKPLTGHSSEPWSSIAHDAKAVRVDNPDALRTLESRLAFADLDVVAQELIPGPESQIESYHVYADEGGEIVADFTGRKIRTYPTEYGHSTALVTTAAPDVAATGRELTRLLGLKGVAKIDFKRRPDDGELVLLEINPRFSLWHHLAARAGLNIPALVYADLAGLPRPAIVPVPPGVTWCKPWLDAASARRAGVPLATWLRWTFRSEAKSLIWWDDPMPFLRGQVWRRLRRRAITSGRHSVPMIGVLVTQV